MAMEAHIVAQFISANPDIGDLLVDGKDVKWKGSLSFTDMAKKVSGGENWLRRYSQLSVFAHPRNPSLGMLFVGEKIALLASYDKQEADKLSRCIYSILSEITQFLGLIEGYAHTAGLEYSENLFAVLSEIREMRQAIEEAQPDLELTSEEEG
ncbi:MAG: hypothetical protein J4F32_05320 [Dehalococcoidia bacterium]|nr:hypothetical protein [Dehalococcoidia bacterium]